MFPDGAHEGLYHTADATLWFFHAIDRYVRATGDTETLRALLPTLVDIVEQHLAGTRSASASIRPTACCARAPRAISSRGWTRRSTTGSSRRGAARRSRSTRSGTTRCACSTRGSPRTAATRRRASISRRRRSARAHRSTRRSGTGDGGYLYDVVDGEQGRRSGVPAEPGLRDRARPSGARSRPLGAGHARSCSERLLTPVGLRSLAPGHPDYKPKYFGDLRARDAAYHQGTVWAWLIGPFIDAWLKVHPGRSRRRAPLPRRLRARISTTPASGRSARSSTPRRRTCRAAASRRPGASRRCCAPWQCCPPDAEVRFNDSIQLMASTRTARLERLASRAPLRSTRRRGACAGARRARAHAHLPGRDRDRRDCSRACRDGCATRPTRVADFPGVGDWVALEPPSPDERRADSRRAAAFQQVLAARRRRPHRRAGRRREHRRRVPGRRPRRRLQPATDRALPGRRLGERRHAGDRAEQGGSRRGSGALRRAGRAPARPASTCTRCRRSSPSRSTRCARISASGRTGGASRIVGRRQVDDREPPDRPRAAATRDVRITDSRGRHTSTARQLVVLGDAGHPDRHAGHARAAAVGRRRSRSRRRSPTSTRWPPAAGSATAVTRRNRAARCARRWQGGDAAGRTLESYLQAGRRTRAPAAAARRARACWKRSAKSKVISKAANRTSRRKSNSRER